MRLLPLWRPKTRCRTAFVLHPSVIHGWFDFTVASRYTSEVLHSLISTSAIVPTVWSLEVAEWLRDLEVRGLESPLRTETFLRGLYPLRICVDRLTYSRAWGSILTHARTHSLQIHDAAYLELALRLTLPLATTDLTLTRSAASAGVPIYTP